MECTVYHPKLKVIGDFNSPEYNRTLAYVGSAKHKEIHIDTDFLDFAEAEVLEYSLRHSDIKYSVDSHPTTFGPMGMSYDCYIKVTMSFPSNLIKSVFKLMNTDYRYAITLNEYSKNEHVVKILFNGCYVYDIKVFNEYENMSDI